MPELSLPQRFESAVSTKTAHQREVDNMRRKMDLDWAPRAGCQPATVAMCCERCVYGTGEHRSDCTSYEIPVALAGALREWAKTAREGLLRRLANFQTAGGSERDIQKRRNKQGSRHQRKRAV